MKSNKEASKNEDEKKERNRTSYSELPDDEDSSSSKPPKKETKSGKEIKESWVFRKSKAKTEKNDPDRFRGEGVNFKAKIIGIEVVFDARGNRMCQDTLQKLKAAVKSSGEHKQRIVLNISLMGIRIKDEKSGELLHHHPVHKISFISQDVGDSRAFGYVYGCPQTGHQFFGIKTEKTAAQVVYTLRDLFQAALELKKKEIAKAMKLQKDDEGDMVNTHMNGQDLHENGTDEKNISMEENGKSNHEEKPKYMEWSPESGDKSTDNIIPSASHENTMDGGCVVDNLLDLQFEMDSLQQGISQMDHTIASAASVGFGISFSEEDNSSGCSFPMTPRKLNRVSSLYHETLSISSRSSSTSDYAAYGQDHSFDNFGAFKNDAFVMASSATPPPTQENPEPPATEDRYAVFYEIDNLASIFDNPNLSHIPEVTESSFINECSNEKIEMMTHGFNENEIVAQEPKAAPSLFAELDPLGNQPYVEKENFFQELKNPPKKGLDNFGGKSCDNSVPLFESGATAHLNQESAVPQEKPNNPFVCAPVSPPKLPPKRSFSVSSTLPASTVKRLENIALAESCTPWPNKNPFNPFANSTDFPDVPPPNSPPPPPPPRLPLKESEPPPVSPPPRPPSRTSAVPTPPRPRRKVPFGAANSTWFSFDQEAISTASAHSQQPWGTMPLSPPLPVPLRKLPSVSKFDSPIHKSCSASNSPASARRVSSLGSNSESSSALNGAVSPGRKMLSAHSSIAQDPGEPKSEAPLLKNPFTTTSTAEVNGSDCAEVKQILSRSPPLPPKSTGISRPRPSPSRKMLSAPPTGSSSSSISSMSNRNESSSSSLRYSNLDETHSSLGSVSEALCTSSFSSRAEETHSSGYNGEVSGISSENSTDEKLSPTSPDSIFRRKSDPFADDFFLSLPKKTTVSSISSSAAESHYANGFSTDINSAKVSPHIEMFKSDTT